jgi:hypothetical protein
MSQIPMQNLLPRFGINFLEDHARRIITDPKIALIELIANCWDAGANRVDILWPTESKPDTIQIQDDGTGMTSEEFTQRWLELNYNRKEAQGEDVVFPPGNQKSHRKAYGINGKGRHSMFCFTNEYKVETWRDGSANVFIVKRAGGISNTPYIISLDNRFSKEGHGTVISAQLARNYVEVIVIHDLIGSKFIVDPSFHIYLNGKLIELTSLKHLLNKREIAVKNYGNIFLSCVDSRKTGKTSRQHGVAWWVNSRLVGEPSWKGLDEVAYIDKRTEAAKRYTFVVEADLLKDDVNEDWSGFKDNDRFIDIQLTVREHVLKWLNELLGDVHKAKKIAAVSPYKKELKELPLDSRYHIGKFLDDLQSRVTVIDDKVLEATVEIMSKLEKTRTGYALLEQLAQLNPNDLEGLHGILESWSVQEARIVLDELGRRLNLIKSLEKLVENPSSDELHDIQPVFEQGLWIFGPEYESLQFLANRSLATIVRTFFKTTIERLKTPQRRPDFVALPDSSIGIYSHDAYDEHGEVAGIGKILIVDLKKGGFEITRKEIRQASDYAIEIRNSGKIGRNTEIIGFVLGTTLALDSQEPLKEGANMCIYSRTYSTVLHQAHARTFNLQKKIEEVKGQQLSDPEIEKALTMPDQSRLSL